MSQATIQQLAILPLLGRSRRERNLGFGFSITVTGYLRHVPQLIVATHSRVGAAFQRGRLNVVRHRFGHGSSLVEIATFIGVDHTVIGQLSLGKQSMTVEARSVATLSQQAHPLYVERPLEEWWELFGDLTEAILKVHGEAMPQAVEEYIPTRSIEGYTWWCQAAARQMTPMLFIPRRKIVKEYERAIACDPNFLEPHCWLGSFYGQIGEYALSERHLQIAAQLKPDDSQVWTALGNLYSETQHIREAQHAFERALSLDERDPEAHLGLGIIYGGAYHDWHREIAELEKVLAIDRNCAEAHFNLGYCYEQLGQISQALDCYRHAVQIGNPLIRMDAMQRAQALWTSNQHLNIL